MLPDRSKRYASADGEIPRLVLTSTWQLLLIALLVLVLLVIIFPRKALVETLYRQQDLDPLTLSYIQNLYRAEPANADVALLLARTHRGSVDTQVMESTLSRLVSEGSPRQRRESTMILFDTYNHRLLNSHDQPAKTEWTTRLIDLMKKAQPEDFSEAMLQAFAARAFELDLPQLGLAFFQQLSQANPQLELERLGDKALAQGQHGVAASYYLLARERARTVDEARRLFRKGIETYMAASQFKLALRASAAHVGDLASDLPTLRFLSRTALAAGDPVLAADYARRLVFVPHPLERQP